ncbi:Phosphatidylglycerophosphate synthase [Parasphingorhabdus marina DSM 22363]|uniref:Phosphatidylglycerophosphate synthase n=1 Tax=Parasphingorhabdus marina DSM 22363 TaxID=1123272 RepID=A0A1N6CVY1_9SPHN|nr:CDP-alcohol phosphatidyltransferase family protein [Parasphingorhabdus marina]SIN62662.1 Phosphatidylglycerophosphate synthase [Parasphingorhabdus marina DSM 22363]
MLDAKLRPLIDPPLNAAGRALARAGFSANIVTLLGMAVGLGGAGAMYAGYYGLAFGLVLAGRILDGLDGAVARATRKTAFGGYLDIVCDFVFYVSVPLAFGLADPRLLPAALVLVSAFTITGISFLAFAVTAAEQGAETDAHGEKSFFYSTGIAEGTETITVFLLMCLFPGWFVQIALVYAVMCVITVIQRSILARQTFRE